VTRPDAYHDLHLLAAAMPPGFERARVSVKITSENANDVMAFVTNAVRAGVPLYTPDNPPPQDESAVCAVRPARIRKPRKPTLASVARQATKAALDVARYEVRLDGSIVVIPGTPEPEPENLWPLDEFCTKEIKQ
jgi:hypothetical protein